MYVCYVCMRVWCNGCWLKVPDGLVAKATPNEVLQGLDFTTFVCVCVFNGLSSGQHQCVGGTGEFGCERLIEQRCVPALDFEMQSGRTAK